MKVASIARPGLRLTLNPPVAPFVLDRRTKHNTMWLRFRVPAIRRALPVPMKQPHPVRPSIVVAVIVKMESTKPMVLLRDPVVIFVRQDLRLPPRPRVVRNAMGPSSKHKAMLNQLPVPIMPPALRVNSAAHQQLPSIEHARIVHRTNFKHRVPLLGLHAHRGPPVELERKDPHRPPPPTVPVPHVPRQNTKHKIHSRGRRARLGPNAPPVKKAPRHRCPSIVFVPIAITGSTKRPPISRGCRVLLGTPVPRAKKERHQVQPLIFLAAIAPLAIFKLKLVTVQPRVHYGVLVPLEKK